MDDSDLKMKIVSIAISKKKGTPKVQVGKASLLEDHGLELAAEAGLLPPGNGADATQHSIAQRVGVAVLDPILGQAAEVQAQWLAAREVGAERIEQVAGGDEALVEYGSFDGVQ